MREAIGSSVMMTFDGTSDDILDMAETVAATLAEAGATPAEIASAMKAAFTAIAQKSPEMVKTCNLLKILTFEFYLCFQRWRKWLLQWQGPW